MSEALATIGQTSEIAWVAPANMTYEQWAQIGSTFQQIESSLPWWLGDWLNAGEVRYGETYTQAIELTGSKIEALKQYKWVAGRIPLHMRRQALSWTHHRLVAKMGEYDQAGWLYTAEQEGWTSAELKRAIADELTEDLTEPATIPSKLTKDATPEEAYDWVTETFDADWLDRFFTLATAT